MLRVFRIIISVFLSIELLVSGIFAGGRIKKAMPEHKKEGITAYVDPLIGTGGIPWMCGMLSSAASVPFGCVRVGPDTCAIGGIAKIKTNTSGYYYEHRHMLGFSLGRLSGTGARDYGMFRVTPAIGGTAGKPAALAYSHNNEIAAPGYYAVYLPGAACLCEMTATDRTGVMRFTFETRKDSSLYIDAASCLSGGNVTDVQISADQTKNSATAQAKLFGTFTGRYQGLTVYLYAEWDRDANIIKSENTGLTLQFGKNTDPITLRMGISFISCENAKKNLESETDGKDFETVCEAASQDWEQRLSAITIDANDEIKTIFYTALYHAMIMPTDFTDSDGSYMGFDKKTHKADGFTYRTDISLWDTCRNVHSLYTLITPEIQRDCAESLLRMAEQSGKLPRWPMGAGESGSMFGNPADLMFAESYIKGIPFDAESAYAYMKNASESNQTRDEAELYLQYGYLPDDLTPSYSVSKTLEYAWEDAAVASMAKALGYYDEAAVYENRARNYRNLWDAGTNYFRPKNSDGSWGNIIPYMNSFFDDIFGTSIFKAYCEGSAPQWRWSVQQDPQGLIELFGGKEAFVKELEKFMQSASLSRAAIDPGAGYWIGNQHDIHTPYLFNDAGRADLTQKWVRWTLKNRFSTDIDGLDGNDDGGTLSSWYVFSALGFYPVVGTDRYWIGSPCIDQAQIRLGNGSILTVTAHNQSEKNVYVKSVALNGEKLDTPFITHEMIRNGGELVFEMTDSVT